MFKCGPQRLPRSAVNEMITVLLNSHAFPLLWLNGCNHSSLTLNCKKGIRPHLMVDSKKSNSCISTQTWTCVEDGAIDSLSEPTSKRPATAGPCVRLHSFCSSENVPTSARSGRNAPADRVHPSLRRLVSKSPQTKKTLTKILNKQKTFS